MQLPQGKYKNISIYSIIYPNISALKSSQLLYIYYRYKKSHQSNIWPWMARYLNPAPYKWLGGRLDKANQSSLNEEHERMEFWWYENECKMIK